MGIRYLYNHRKYMIRKINKVLSGEDVGNIGTESKLEDLNSTEYHRCEPDFSIRKIYRNE